MTDVTPPEYQAGETNAQVAKAWMRTIFGIALMGVLTAGAVLLVGFHLSIAAVVLGLFALLPVISWFYSDEIIRKLTRCERPNAEDPDHVRLMAVVERVFPKTGLTIMPAVYVSPIPIANAFATGRNHSRAMIAVTEGLFFAELNDDELEAIIAHELAHVKSYDSAITSMLAAMGSLFAIVLATGLPFVFGSSFVSRTEAPLLNRLARRVGEKKRFFVPTGGLLGLIVMMGLFYVISIFTKLLSTFVSRARECSADAYAALWTEKPCALSTALQKLVIFENRNGGNVNMMVLTRGMLPLFIVNPFTDEDLDETTALTRGQRLRRWWQRLGQNHPPVSQRMRTLDQMSGGTCPRLV
jgi:heat shock protein HtpX